MTTDARCTDTSDLQSKQNDQDDIWEKIQIPSADAGVATAYGIPIDRCSGTWSSMPTFQSGGWRPYDSCVRIDKARGRISTLVKMLKTPVKILQQQQQSCSTTTTQPGTHDGQKTDSTEPTIDAYQGERTNEHSTYIRGILKEDVAKELISISAYLEETAATIHECIVTTTKQALRSQYVPELMGQGVLLPVSTSTLPAREKKEPEKRRKQERQSGSSTDAACAQGKKDTHTPGKSTIDVVLSENPPWGDV